MREVSEFELFLETLSKLTTATATWQNKWLCPCIIKLCIFFSRSLQNNNVKSLHYAYLRQRQFQRQIFHVSIGKLRLPSHIHVKIINLDEVRQPEYIQPFAKFEREMQVQFLIDVFLGVAVVVA